MSIDYRRVQSERRTSETAKVFAPDERNPFILPLLYRGSMLTGLPCANVEAVYVTRTARAEKFEPHLDVGPGFGLDRVDTILVYLNDVGPVELWR